MKQHDKIFSLVIFMLALSQVGHTSEKQGQNTDDATSIADIGTIIFYAQKCNIYNTLDKDTEQLLKKLPDSNYLSDIYNKAKTGTPSIMDFRMRILLEACSFTCIASCQDFFSNLLDASKEKLQEIEKRNISSITKNAEECKPKSNPKFSLNCEGTVSDIENGIEWKICAEGQIFDPKTFKCAGEPSEYNWQMALAKIRQVNDNNGFAGHTYRLACSNII